MSRRGMFQGRRLGAPRGGSGLAAWGKPQAGGLTPAQRAEAAALAAATPNHRFRTDTYTLSAGNLATLPNIAPGGVGALTVAAGTVAEPAPSALFGGRKSLTLAGTQYLASNLPATTWKFLHGDGEWMIVFAGANTTGLQILIATVDGTVTRGVQVYHSSGTETQYIASSNTASMPGGSIAANTPTYWMGSVSSTDPFRAQLFAKDAIAATNTALTISTADPNSTLNIGARQGSSAFAGQIVEAVFFPRQLHEYQRQLWREYFAAQYPVAALAAPSLVGADREIMSELPFSFLDPAAYSTSAGKVTAFLDRAMPGHTYAQANTAAQVLNPTANAGFNNALTAQFLAATFHRYISSLAAAQWKFTHDGSGLDMFLIAAITATSGHQLSTNTGGSASFAFGDLTTAPRVIMLNNAGAASVGADSSATGTGLGTGLIDGTPRYFEFSDKAGDAVEYELRHRGSIIASGVGSARGTNAPPVSLNIGWRAVGAAPATMSLAGLPIFNRKLSASSRLKMQGALLSKFGLAA